MKDRIFVDKGRLFYVREPLLVLKVGIGENDMTGPVRLGQHSLEFDLG